jgi:hypothetical protein
MATRLYTAHLAPGDDPAATLFIADRWRWGAALAPLLWALWNRHWLLAVPVATIGLGSGALAAIGQPEAAVALDLGLRAALGFEGGAAARLDRKLRGWRELAAIPAATETEAVWAWFGPPPDLAEARR